MMWCVFSGCGIALVGVSMALVGMAWPRGVWHDLRGCRMASLGVSKPQLVWHYLNGCGMASVGVVCGMGSIGVTWRKWVWHGLSRPQCVCLWPQCMYLCLCRCSMASGCPKWVWHILSVWNGLSGCSMASVVVSMASVGVSWSQWVWWGCGIASVGVPMD